jgi:transposase-like protein
MFQPLFVRPLTPDERQGLEQFLHTSNKEEGVRARVILASAQGKTAVEISQSMGSHPSNIKKWIRTFNARGIGVYPQSAVRKVGLGPSSALLKSRRC